MPNKTQILDEMIKKISSGAIKDVAYAQAEQPQTVDPLAGLNKQASNLEQRMVQGNIDPTQFTDTRNFLEKGFNLPENQNWLFDIFDVLGRPQQAVFNAIKQQQIGSVPAQQAMWEGLSGKAPKVNFGEVIRGGMGQFEERPEGTIDWTDVVGFAGDVFLDPADLAFIPAGLVKDGVSIVAKAAKAGDDIVDAASGFVKASKGLQDVMDITGEVTEEIIAKAAKAGVDPQAYADALTRATKVGQDAIDKIYADYPKSMPNMANSITREGAKLTKKNLYSGSQFIEDQLSVLNNKLSAFPGIATKARAQTGTMKALYEGIFVQADDVMDYIVDTKRIFDTMGEPEITGFFSKLGKNYKLIKQGEQFLSPTDLVMRSLWGTAKSATGISGMAIEGVAKALGKGDAYEAMIHQLQNTFDHTRALPGEVVKSFRESFGSESVARAYAAEKMTIIKDISARMADNMGVDPEEINTKLNQWHALRNYRGKMPARLVLNSKAPFPFDITAYNELAKFIQVPEGKTIGDVLPVVTLQGRNWIDLSLFDETLIKRKLPDVSLDDLIDVPRILNKREIEELTEFASRPGFQEGYTEFAAHWDDMLHKVPQFLGIDYVNTTDGYMRNAISVDYEYRLSQQAARKFDEKTADLVEPSRIRGNPRSFKTRTMPAGAQEANIWSNASLEARVKNKLATDVVDELKFPAMSDLATQIAKDYDEGTGILNPRVRAAISGLLDDFYKPIREQLGQQMQDAYGVPESLKDVDITQTAPMRVFKRNGVRTSTLSALLADDELNQAIFLKQNSPKTLTDLFGDEVLDEIPDEFIELTPQSSRALKDADTVEFLDQIVSDKVKAMSREEIDVSDMAKRLNPNDLEIYETLAAEEVKRAEEMVVEGFTSNAAWTHGLTQEEAYAKILDQVSAEGSRKFAGQYATEALLSPDNTVNPIKEFYTKVAGSELHTTLKAAKTADENVDALRKVMESENVPADLRKEYDEVIKPKIEAYEEAKKLSAQAPKLKPGVDPIEIDQRMNDTITIALKGGRSTSEWYRSAHVKKFDNTALGLKFDAPTLSYNKAPVIITRAELSEMRKNIMKLTYDDFAIGDTYNRSEEWLADKVMDHWINLSKIDSAYGTDLSNVGIFKNFDKKLMGIPTVKEFGDPIGSLHDSAKDVLNHALNRNRRTSTARFPLKRYTPELDEKLKNFVAKEFTDEEQSFLPMRSYSSEFDSDGRLMGWSSAINKKSLAADGIEVTHEGGVFKVSITDKAKAQSQYYIKNVHNVLKTLDAELGTNYAYSGIFGDIFDAPNVVEEVTDGLKRVGQVTKTITKSDLDLLANKISAMRDQMDVTENLLGRKGTEATNAELDNILTGIPTGGKRITPRYISFIRKIIDLDDGLVDDIEPLLTKLDTEYGTAFMKYAQEAAPKVADEAAQTTEKVVTAVGTAKLDKEVWEFSTKLKAELRDQLKENAKLARQSAANASEAKLLANQAAYKARKEIVDTAEKTAKKQAKLDVLDQARKLREEAKITVSNQELKETPLADIAKRMSPDDQARFDQLTKDGMDKAIKDVDDAIAKGDLAESARQTKIEELAAANTKSRQESFIRGRANVEYSPEELLDRKITQARKVMKSIEHFTSTSVELKAGFNEFKIADETTQKLLVHIAEKTGVPTSIIKKLNTEQGMQIVNNYAAQLQNEVISGLITKQRSTLDFIDDLTANHKTFSEDVLYSIDSWIDKFSREGRNARIYKTVFNHVAFGDFGDPDALIRYLPKDIYDSVSELEAAKLTAKGRGGALKRNIPIGYKLIENPTDFIAKLKGANKFAQDQNIVDAINWVSSHVDPEQGRIVVESNLARLLTLNVEKDANAMLDLIDFTNQIFKRFKLLTPGFNIRNVLGIMTNMWLGAVEIEEMPKWFKAADDVFKNGKRLMTVFAESLTDAEWIAKTTVEERNMFKIYNRFLEGQFQVPRTMKEVLATGLTGTGSEIQDIATRTTDDLGQDTVTSMIKPGEGANLPGIVKKGLDVADKVSLVNGWMNETVDAYGRMAVLAKAMDPETGADYLNMLDVGNEIDAVRLVMFDPKNISQTESQVLRRLVPFYSFTKMNLAYHLQNVPNNASRYYRLVKAMRKSWQLAGVNEEDVDPFKLDQMYIPIPGINQNGKYFAIKANLPQSDLVEFIANPLKRGLGSMAPYIKAPFEMATNVQVFSGQPIERFAGERSTALPFLSKKAEYGLSQTGLDAPLKSIYGLATGDLGKFANIISEGDVSKTRLSKAYTELEKLQDGVKLLKQKNITLPELASRNESTQTVKLTEAQRILAQILGK